MKKGKKIGEILKQHLAQANDEDIEKAGAEVWARIQADLPRTRWYVRALKPMEVQVMTAVQLLGEHAVHAAIGEKVDELCGQTILLPVVDSVLDQLVESKLLQRNGTRFGVTETGEFALRRAMAEVRETANGAVRQES